MTTTVVNMRSGDQYDVRIDRRTKWGNPFIIGKDGTRAEVIEQYEEDLDSRLEIGTLRFIELASLAGKRLGCWCAPEPCHGDVLARRADEAMEQLRQATR